MCCQCDNPYCRSGSSMTIKSTFKASVFGADAATGIALLPRFLSKTTAAADARVTRMELAPYSKSLVPSCVIQSNKSAANRERCVLSVQLNSKVEHGRVASRAGCVLRAGGRSSFLCTEKDPVG